MAGWHHWLDRRESEWTPEVGDEQGVLACCDSWGRKEADTTERLNWTKLKLCWTFLVAQNVKRLSRIPETQVRSLGREDPLEKEMAIHYTTFDWKIPWTEEPGRLQSMSWPRLSDFTFTFTLSYGSCNEDNHDLLQKIPFTFCCTQCPQPAADHCRPNPLLETPRYSWASLGQSLVGSLLLSLGSWHVQAFVYAR